MSNNINTRLLSAPDSSNNPNNLSRSGSSHPVDLESAVSSVQTQEEVELAIQAADKDSSPEAKAARLKTAIRAICGELLATTIFMYSVCGFAINVDRIAGMSANVDGIVPGALFQGFTGIAVIYTFADISGAHFNPAVTAACWLTGKTSNRKTIGYLFAQLLGVNLAMLALYASFGTKDIFDIIVVAPKDNVPIGSVFAIEFFLTFILVFIIFTVAFEDVEQQKRATMSFRGIANNRGLTVYTTTPQSKTGKC